MFRLPSLSSKMPAVLSKRGEIRGQTGEFPILKCKNREFTRLTRISLLRRIPMCDFAADADAARQLLVGRVLTVERVRQLNAKDYFYQMLKDNPEMLKIYPGIENELLKGAIDCHIHAYPDFVHRSQDMIQIAIEASKCGMRAIAFKDHWNLSATSAYLAQRHIDDMIARGELTNRVEVYGGVGMCFGMRPEYVRVGLQYPNFKMICFPTFNFYGFWRGVGHPAHEDVR